MDRKCLECGENLHGRIDKKFCSDACRNAFNNKQRLASDLKLVLRINKILARNRKILEALNSTVNKPVHRSVLLIRGFDFGYYTSRRVSKSGKVFYYCYDHGYCSLGNNFIRVVWRPAADFAE